MTPPRRPRQRRLTAIENELGLVQTELRLMRRAIPQVLALQALTAQQAATIARLIGENDRFRDCIKRQAERLRASGAI